MLYVPILTAIETMLSADASTKDLIKAYRLFTAPESGSRMTPLCVMAPNLDVEPGISGFGPTILRNTKVPIEIHLLERSYDIQDRHKAAVTAMDTLQHNVCNVFEADPCLSASVANSKITRIQLQRYDAEYFEFVITLLVDTKLE